MSIPKKAVVAELTVRIQFAGLTEKGVKEIADSWEKEIMQRAQYPIPSAYTGYSATLEIGSIGDEK